ncbi:MAG: Rne/Rng family ribonuclease [Alphaproteobacteria bacterium]|nr:Rne/Rng family ribonuclease [Alphaproteobacteria bacterium]
MARRMLIDASHPEETRVAVVNGKRLEDFDYETSRKRQLKGNVYLAKVVRVEPSLQAAFVDYGGNRHGFLAFSEIHPDYYQIPVADREQLLAEEAEAEEAEDSENGGPVETVGGDEVEEVERKRIKHYRHYKIQEVIKRRQIMLVQVVKEERGNKGAALTTYLSLAGRYCVLMPNTGRGGGISRKIGNVKDRRRLKKILDEFKISPGMAVIVRTAGAERTKAEIKRDYEYLVRLWDDIRNRTMESIAPTLVHEEANLIKRSIRDLYDKDIDDVLVEGEMGYRVAKDFMKAMVPSHAKRVQRYDDPVIPLFFRYQVESQIDAIYNPIVQLRSGGYLVIHSTEALVAIDVNSGRATRERHIEETALKTNQEAAEEVARQLRLRDLAGLIVIDFIDMEENRNNSAVERRLKEALRNDRARIQIGHISAFGLLEMSRQRLRPSLLETSSELCPACGGTGHIRSTESTALHVMRGIEEEGLRRRAAEIDVFVPSSVALYILNHKRDIIASIEERCDLTVVVAADDGLIPPEFRIERVRSREGEEGEAEAEEVSASEETVDDGGRRKRRPRRRRKDRREVEAVEAPDAGEPEEETAETAETAAGADGEDGEEEPRKRRRRGKRGGRRRSRKAADAVSDSPVTPVDGPDGAEPETPEQPVVAEPEWDDRVAEAAPEEPVAAAAPPPKRAGRRRKRTEAPDPDAKAPQNEAESMDAAAAPVDDAAEIPAVEDKPKPRRRPGAAAKTGARKEPKAKSAAVKRPAGRTRKTAKKTAAAEFGGDDATPDKRHNEEPEIDTGIAPRLSEPAAPATADHVPGSVYAGSASGEELPVDQGAPEPLEDAKPKRTGWWRRSPG